MTSILDNTNYSDIDLVNMPYRNLQKLAKIFKLPGNVKRETMVWLIQARRDGNEEIINEFYKARKCLQDIKHQRKQDIKSSSLNLAECQPKLGKMNQEHCQRLLNKIHNNLYGNSFYRPMCPGQQHFQHPSSPRFSQRPQPSLQPINQLLPSTNTFRKTMPIPLPPPLTRLPTYYGPRPPPSTTFSQQEAMAMPDYYTSFHEQYHPLNNYMNQNIGNGEMIPSLEAQQTFTQLNDMNTPSQQPHMLSCAYQQQTVVCAAQAQRDWSSCYDTNPENGTRFPFMRVEQKKVIDLSKDVESDQCKIIANFTETVMCASKNIKPNVNWNCNYLGKSFQPSQVEDRDTLWPSLSTSNSDTASIPEAREPERAAQEPVFACRYFDGGCTKKLNFYQILEHETHCLYQGSKCLFRDCNWISLMKHLPDHLIQIHSRGITLNNEMIMPIELDNIVQMGRFSYLQCFNQRIFYITLLHVPPEYLCISIQFIPDEQQVNSFGDIEIMLDQAWIEENMDSMPTRWCGSIEPYHAHLLPNVANSLSVKFNSLPSHFSVCTNVSSSSNQNATVTK